MMESIGKLRELCAKWRKTSITPGRNSAADEVDAIADEIEREIAERYMELPVDADGVPIHYGDSLAYCGEHGGTVTGKVCNMEYRERSYGEADWLVNVAGWVFPGDTCHVKPRTVEDILREFGDWYKHVAGGCDEPGIIAEYADELRSMGVGE